MCNSYLQSTNVTVYMEVDYNLILYYSLENLGCFPSLLLITIGSVVLLVEIKYILIQGL